MDTDHSWKDSFCDTYGYHSQNSYAGMCWDTTKAGIFTILEEQISY